MLPLLLFTATEFQSCSIARLIRRNLKSALLRRVSLFPCTLETIKRHLVATHGESVRSVSAISIDEDAGCCTVEKSEWICGKSDFSAEAILASLPSFATQYHTFYHHLRETHHLCRSCLSCTHRIAFFVYSSSKRGNARQPSEWGHRSGPNTRLHLGTIKGTCLATQRLSDNQCHHSD